MKKLLSALLALCMLLSVCCALAEVTREDIDTPCDPPINLTAWRFLSSVIQYENGDTIEKNIYPDPVRISFPAKILHDGLDHGLCEGIK